MFVTVKALLRTLILPPAGPLLLAFAGAWLLRARVTGGPRRAGWVLLLAGLACLWVLSLPRVADILTRSAEREPALDLARPVEAQAIVILGGGDEREAPEYGGEPAAGPVLLARLAYGAYLAQRTALPVLVTGTPEESQAMQVSLAREFGVTVRWVEGASRDTFQNAQFTARLLKDSGITRILLVTDATHERRARREFESTGLAVVPAPVGTTGRHHKYFRDYMPDVGALARSTTALYELLGEVARQGFDVFDVRRHTP